MCRRRMDSNNSQSLDGSGAAEKCRYKAHTSAPVKVASCAHLTCYLYGIKNSKISQLVVVEYIKETHGRATWYS